MNDWVYDGLDDAFMVWSESDREHLLSITETDLVTDLIRQHAEGTFPVPDGVAVQDYCQTWAANWCHQIRVCAADLEQWS